MLILSRKNHESVVVGAADGCHGVLKVTVLQITRGRVKLGFEGDTEVPIHRSEVWERIHPADSPESLANGPAAPTG